MAAITTHLHHPPPLPLSKPPHRAPQCNPYLRLRLPSAPLLLRCPAAAAAADRATATPLAALDDDNTIPDAEPRNSPLELSPLLVATAVASAAAAAATPQAALALSGGSMGGCDDDSSSSSSCCDDSTSSLTEWFPSSSSSSSSKPKEEGAEAAETHVSVGTAAAPPVAVSPDAQFWGNVALASFGAAALFFVVKNCSLPGETTAVVKLQVALRGTATAKSLQRDLNAIAGKVEASNRRWYKFILAETISSLRRHKNFCISSSLAVLKDTNGSWREHFNAISMAERSKFDEETLSNLQGIKRNKIYSMKTDGNRNEYIVLTILVAADGTLNLPEAIRSMADLEAAAIRLSLTPESDLRGVQVLWAPQDQDDVLSGERMRKDYPFLKPLA